MEQIETPKNNKYVQTNAVKSEYILCNTVKKCSKRIGKETYEEYLDVIMNRDIEKDRWIYNIIDGIAEQENITYRDDFSITMPTYTWDAKNVERLHILCIPLDKQLRTIRELTKEHIPLLQHMKKTTLEKIEEVYGLKEGSLKIYFHYDPSTYHLHIHFVNIRYKDAGSSVEYSHDLDSVIFNLTLDSDYYKKIKLNRRFVIVQNSLPLNSYFSRSMHSEQSNEVT
jgi:diadenosine tetraphosphate (Ap4A) HIT family hydrolase